VRVHLQASPPTSPTPRTHAPAPAVIVSANGEIYNYRELYQQDVPPGFYTPKTGSDCEVVIPLYLKHGKDFPNLLRGMFSFVLYDRRDDRSVLCWCAGRASWWTCVCGVGLRLTQAWPPCRSPASPLIRAATSSSATTWASRPSTSATAPTAASGSPLR
jgi:hypothetical protein